MDGTAQQVLALQRQYAASVIDAAAKQAFHSKRSALTVADLPVKAYGHGGASGPAQLLHVPEADGLLVRADAQLDTAEVSERSKLRCGSCRSVGAPQGLAHPRYHYAHLAQRCMSHLPTAAAAAAQGPHGDLGAAALAGH